MSDDHSSTHGPTLVFDRTTWVTFVADVANGAFGR
jgi:hypothetical protein